MRLPSVDMLGTVRLLRKIPGVLFLLAFLVFLVTSNVRIAFNSVALYELGFSSHDVARTTGLEPAELSKAAEQVRDYFNSSDELLDVRISVDGVTRSIFVEREILHMRDVKDVAWTAFRIQEGSALYLFFFVTVGFFVHGGEFSRPVSRLVTRGSALTVVIIVLAGVVAAIGFRPIFVLFHQLSFSNDLWQLDPLTSYLVQMFPLGFWLDATLLLAVASVVEAISAVVLLKLISWWRQWLARVAQSKAPQFV